MLPYFFSSVLCPSSNIYFCLSSTSLSHELLGTEVILIFCNLTFYHRYITHQSLWGSLTFFASYQLDIVFIFYEFLLQSFPPSFAPWLIILTSQISTFLFFCPCRGSSTTRLFCLCLLSISLPRFQNLNPLTFLSLPPYVACTHWIAVFLPVCADRISRDWKASLLTPSHH